MSHDDVLLEAAEVVDLAEGGRLGEDARGVLEGGGGDEGVGLEGDLGDAEQELLGLGGDAALLDDALVLLAELALLDGLAGVEAGLAGLGDADEAHHLADDDLDVLVVDLDAL